MNPSDIGPLLKHSVLNLLIDLRSKRHGPKQYAGSPIEILKSIQNDLWNGSFIQGSTGHFRQYWVRDLCLFYDAYIKTGQSDRLKQSLQWGLENFRKQNRITTTIWPNAQAYNIFTEPADSLPLLIWAIRRTGFSDLWMKYRDFLIAQSKDYFATRLEPNGLPTRLRDYTGLKDAVSRKGASYTFFMAWCLAENLKALHDPVTFIPTFSWPQIFEKYFWSPEGFVFEDRERENFFSTDVNLIPFWLGLVNFNEKWVSVKKAIDARKLTTPLAIMTSEFRRPHREKLISRLTAPNYQGDTIWANLGMIYLGLLRKAQSPDYAAELEKWRERVKCDQNFLEVFYSMGRPFRTWFYTCDEGMNWSVQLLKELSKD